MERREIGLQLEFFEVSPFLKTRITFAMFSLSGKIPVSKDSLIKMATSTEMCGSRIFSNLIRILFGPEDFPFFYCLNHQGYFI